jgi:PAS domain S-box-containing protein
MRVADALAIVAGTVALVVVVGWALDVPRLTSLLPGAASMRPITAIGFVMASVGLWMDVHGGKLRTAGRALLGVVAILGAAQFMDGLLEWRRDAGGVPMPPADDAQLLGRMEPLPALAFALMGVGALASEASSRWLLIVGQSFLAVVALCAVYTLFAYAYDINALYRVPGAASMTLHSAILFVLLAVASVLAHPDRGVAALIADRWPHGTLLRRLLPVLLLTPLIIGWMAVFGPQGNGEGGAYAALISTGGVALLAGFMLWSTLSLRQYERQLQLTTEDLASSEQMFRVSFENAFVGMAYLDADLRWIRVNTRFSDLLGYEAEALLDRGLKDVIHPDDVAVLDERLQALRAGSADLHRGVDRWVTRQGEVRQFEFRVTALRGPDAAFRHFIFVVQDVTDAKRTAAQLRTLAIEREELLRTALEDRSRAVDAARARDVLLAVVSHELRSPLNTIRLWASLLQTDASRNENMIQRAVQQIENGVEAQTRLINDLLDASRIASGKLELERESVDMRALVLDVIAEHSPPADRKRVRITMDSAEGAIVVDGDRGRLRQVVSNLVDNAVKFTPDSGQIGVSIRVEGQQLSLRVRDSGVGIDADQLPHIFDQFWQAKTPISARHGGLGLGLHIVKHVVERHGGSVTARSEGAGTGAEFAVYLPLVEAARSAASPGMEPAQAAASGPAGDVLVVDDEVDTAEALTLALRIRGLEVRVVFDGGAALEAIAKRRPRIVVSDLSMPGMDGFELVRRIRAQEHDDNVARVRAIAITGREAASDRWRARRAGFDVYLTKPVRVQDLFKRISDALAEAGVAQKAPLTVWALAASGDIVQAVKSAGHEVEVLQRYADAAELAQRAAPRVLVVDLDAVDGDVERLVNDLRENRLSMFAIGLASVRRETADGDVFDSMLEKPVQPDELTRSLRHAQEVVARGAS